MYSSFVVVVVFIWTLLRIILHISTLYILFYAYATKPTDWQHFSEDNSFYSQLLCTTELIPALCFKVEAEPLYEVLWDQVVMQSLIGRESQKHISIHPAGTLVFTSSVCISSLVSCHKR